MSTLNRYLSNATKKGISAQQSYDNLISEFRKGPITLSHKIIIVIDLNSISHTDFESKKDLFCVSLST